MEKNEFWGLRILVIDPKKLTEEELEKRAIAWERIMQLSFIHKGDEE